MDATFIGKAAIRKLLTFASSLTYEKLRRSHTIFPLLVEAGIERPKDEFVSIYLHSCLLLGAKTRNNLLVQLFWLSDSQIAFNQEFSHSNHGAFRRALDSAIHTDKDFRELKNWNSIPQKHIDDFKEIYDSLINDVASPVENTLLKGQEDIQHGLERLQFDATRNQNDIRQQLDLILKTSGLNEANILANEYGRQIKSIHDTFKRGRVNEALERYLSLENEVWGKLNDDLRFKLLTNIGVCYGEKALTEKASDYLIKAHPFKPDGESALSNIVNAYIGISDFEKARNYLDIFLSKHPESIQAKSVALRVRQTRNDFDHELSKLSPEIAERFEILLSIGLAYKRFQEYELSIQNLEKALLIHDDNLLLLEHLLIAYVEYFSSDFRKVNLQIITSQDEQKINRAIHLTESLLKLLETSDLPDLKSSTHAISSFFSQLLGLYDDAIRSIDIALYLNRNDPKLLKQKGSILAYSKDWKGCLNTLKSIEDYSEVPDVPSTLAHMYMIDGNIREAVLILEKYLSDGLDSKLKEQNQSFLIELWIKAGEDEKLRNYESEFESSETVFGYLGLASVKRYFEDENRANEILIEAKAQSLNTSYRERFMLCEELAAADLIEDAIEVFQTIVNEDVENDLTIRLVRMCYQAGWKSKSLKILQNLRSKNGFSRIASSMEILIYQEYSDYEQAFLIGSQFMQVFPEDIEMHIRISGIAIRLEKFEFSDAFLEKTISVNEIPIEAFKSYLAQLNARGFRKKLLHLLYEFRRLHSDHTAHELYVNTILQFNIGDEEILSSETVEAGFAVILEDDNEQILTLILENENRIDAVENEINASDTKYKILNHRKVGDKIEFPGSTVEWTIKTILNKYFWAFKESKLKCSTVFGEKSQIKFFTSKDIPDFLKELHEENTSYEENLSIAFDLHKNRKAPLAVIATRFNENPILIWEKLISRVGILTSSGLKSEMDSAVDLLQNDQRLIADISSLLTLFELNLGDAILENFGKIIITTSTKDLVLDVLNSLFSNQENEGEANKIQDLFHFVRSYTEERAPSLSQNLDKSKKDLVKFIGTSFLDTLILSEESGFTLLCDDLAFRDIAIAGYKIDTTWTQCLLIYLSSQNRISNEEYRKSVIKLVDFKYRYTSIDSRILMNALKKSNYKLNPPFTSCLQLLNGRISDENSSLIVGCTFMVELWGTENMNTDIKEYITDSILTSLFINRSIFHISRSLAGIIRAAISEPSKAEELHNWRMIKSCVNQWLSLRGLSKRARLS